MDGLRQCIKEYYESLSADKKIISTEDLKFLFNDIATIHQLNATFLKDLSAQYENFKNESTLIGDQFVKFCPYFRMYQNYCNNYDQAMVVLNKYSEKQSFQALTMEIRDRCNGKTLQSLLMYVVLCCVHSSIRMRNKTFFFCQIAHSKTTTIQIVFI